MQTFGIEVEHTKPTYCTSAELKKHTVKGEKEFIPGNNVLAAFSSVIMVCRAPCFFMLSLDSLLSALLLAASVHHLGRENLLLINNALKKMKLNF